MRTRRLILAAILTGLAVLVTACSTGQANNAPDASSEEGVREETASRFAELLNENGVPGGVLVVRQGGTEQAYPVGVANESGAAVTDDTLFAYRSVTKSFVVTALLQLADEGVVDLDAPSTSQFDGMNPAVTPRQLAVMRSGVPNYSAQPELLSLIQENPERRWDDSELLSLVAGVPESFAPGTSYQYSNTNTVLIGQIIEAATGSAWSQVVKDRILTPLGLDSVVYPDNDTSITNIASPYAVDSDGAEALPVVQASAFSAAGGLYGTASDLAAWAEALGTGSVLSAAVQQERLESFSSTSADEASPYYEEYGLGIGKIGDWVGHTGNGLGYQSLAMYNTTTGMSIAICLNASGEDGDLPAHILEALEDDITTQ